MNKDLMIIIVDDELEALTHFLYQVVEEKNICYKFRFIDYYNIF